MCLGPEIMALLSVAATVGQTVMNMSAADDEAESTVRAEQLAAEREAAAAEAEIALVERQAQLAQEDAERKADALREEGDRLKSRQRASFGASGVRLAGTPASVLAETEEQTQEDVLLALHSGTLAQESASTEIESIRTAAGFNREASNIRQDTATRRGSNKSRGSLLDGVLGTTRLGADIKFGN